MHKASPVIEQWDIAIGGNKIPALTKEDVATISTNAGESFESRFNERVEAQKQNTVSKDQLTDDAHQAMLKFLWAKEIMRIYRTATYSYAQLLKSPEDTQQLQAYCQIAGLVIEAADQGATEMPGPVLCLEVEKAMRVPGSPLFLSVMPGDKFITLDLPFVLNMHSDGKIKEHGGAGVRVGYCLQYKFGGPNGMTIQNAGLVFLQFMSTQRHWSNLSALASIMKDKMAFYTRVHLGP